MRAWVEHMSSHRRRQLMMCVHIRSMVGPPRGIILYGFQWVLSLKKRLVMREVSLVLYKQPGPSSPNRCRIMASSHSYHKIWKDALVPKRTYHYYHPDSKGLNFAALLDDVKV